MKANRHLLTTAAWAYPIAGLVMALLFLVVGDDVRSFLAAITMLAVIPGGVVAARVHGFPRVFSIGIAAVGTLYVIEGASAEWDSLEGDVAVATIVDLVATGFLIVLTVFLVHRQRGGLEMSDALDGVIIGVGAWLVSWVVFVQPFLDTADQSAAALALNSMFLPTAVVLLALAAVMVFGGGRPRPSIVMLSAGLLCNVSGDAVYALAEVRDVGAWAYTGADMLYLLSVAMCGGALIHPSAPALIGQTTVSRGIALPGRLTALLASLIAPVMLVALVSSSSNFDRGVRGASVLLLLVLVGSRLYSATGGQIRLQHELAETARTDELTDLPNKRALLEHANDVINDRWRSDLRPAMYLFDLDGFKNINDSLSHAVGDEVLCVIARRLSAAAHAIGAQVYRVSGDEFVVFDSSPDSSNRALDNARAIHIAFQQSLSTTSGELFVKASCGVASMEPGSPTASEELFRWADIAMYRAKAAGRNRVVLYEASMQERVSTRMDIENALHGALDRNELHLYHQPIIEISTGRVTGLESLIRWRRPDGTVLLPDEFIPIAEETGMIDDIGSWAVNESLQQLRMWINDGIVPPDTTVSVNVSPRQLADPRFVDVVSGAVQRSGLDPDLLWLEITESAMIENPDLARSALEQIRSTGVRLALDDFGTGYSSLSLLQQFPIQRIKIDRAFVGSIVENINDRTLVRTIIGLGDSMGVDIVAEGVDTVLQLRLLRDLGCAKAQGFLISHPAPAQAMRSTISALDSLSQWPEFSSLVGDSPLPRRPRRRP